MQLLGSHGCNEGITDISKRQILGIDVLFHHPIIRLQENGIRKRDKMVRQHVDDIAHAGNCMTCWMIDILEVEVSTTITCTKSKPTSFWLEYTASASNPSSPCSLSLTCLLTHMYPLRPKIRSTPHGSVMKCDLRRRTSTEGTTISWPFRSFGKKNMRNAVDGGPTELTLPYLRERVWSDMAPSEKKACTSATSRSPSSKKVRICSSSLSSFLRCYAQE